MRKVWPARSFPRQVAAQDVLEKRSDEDTDEQETQKPAITLLCERRAPRYVVPTAFPYTYMYDRFTARAVLMSSSFIIVLAELASRDSDWRFIRDSAPAPPYPIRGREKYLRYFQVFFEGKNTWVFWVPLLTNTSNNILGHG